MGIIYKRGIYPNRFCSPKLVASAHPNLKYNIEQSIIVDSIDSFNYYTKEDLEEFTVNGEKVSLSLNLIRDVLNYDSLFTYFLNNAKYDKSLGISLLYINEEGQKDNIVIPKAYFASAINQYISKEEEVSSIVNTRVHFINALTSATVAVNRYYNGNFEYLVDGIKIEIPYSTLLRVIVYDNLFEHFMRYGIENLDIPKEKIAYGIVLFCAKEELFNKYVFDEDVIQRYKTLQDYKNIDFESVNKLNKSDDIQPDGTSMIDNISVNEELYTELMKYNKASYSKLEQAIYLYIRLCDLLTIDDEHYSNSADNELTGIHENINNINNISINNNRIVSYEFALLYAKLLKDLDITYSTTLNSLVGYSNSRSMISFKQGEFIVLIDLFKDILVNDFNSVKNNKELISINCENTNEASKNKFNEILYEVYKSYKEDKTKEEQFAQDLNTYINMYQQDVSISRRERLYTILKLIGNKRLKGNDSIPYVNRVVRLISDQDRNITIDNMYTVIDQHTRPVYVITVHDNHIYNYIIVDVNNEEVIKTISQEELLDMLNKGILLTDDDKTNDMEDEIDARTIKDEGIGTSRKQ